MSASLGGKSISHRLRWRAYCAPAVFFFFAQALSHTSLVFAQDPERQRAAIVVEGSVRDAADQPVADASVFLEDKRGARLVKTQTNADGGFVFSLNKAGIYGLRAEKDGSSGAAKSLLVLKSGDRQRCDIILAATSSTSNPAAASGLNPAASSSADSPNMELSDEPSFTVAGVTDWSNAGLHGSDTRARTSDALAKDTLALKSDGAVTGKNASPNAAYDLALEYRGKGELARAREEARKSLEASDTAAGHRLLAELNEQLGDPVAAVREFETAARMQPNEQNYLEWGAELLLHKAVQPAVQVFSKGSSLHPDSSRLAAGLGAAFYAAGSYDEAAQRLCAASDLNPVNSAPYLFLGKMQESTSTPSSCGEERLARFVQQQPEDALANYYYATALWKAGRVSNSVTNRDEVEALLEKAVRLDPHLGEAYVQLGIVRAARGDFASAIDAYMKAISANPNLADAHYQLSLAYKRTGEEARARKEFQAYQQAHEADRTETDRQRRELRQFVIILKDPPGAQEPPSTPRD